MEPEDKPEPLNKPDFLPTNSHLPSIGFQVVSSEPQSVNKASGLGEQEGFPGLDNASDPQMATSKEVGALE